MKDIIVYTSSTCSFCTLIKDFYKSKGIDYTEKNIATDVTARKELMAMGHMGVPVSIINGEEVVGFDKPKLEALLA